MCYPKVLLLFGGKTRRIYTSFFSLAEKGKGARGSNKQTPAKTGDVKVERWSQKEVNLDKNIQHYLGR
jgi:hypothetical protein